jgi:hypothetical protein
MDILRLKLKHDLLHLSLDYVNDSILDEPVFTKWIQEKINIYIDEQPLSFNINSDIDVHKCKARLWNKGQGEKQCSHKQVKGYYCEKHTRMLQQDKVLRFGDIREDRPIYDLIKLDKGQTERLHWIDPNPLNQLQQVLDTQSQKVILTTPTLILH